MGWMEILAALQKAVPLLTRAVPMLEVFVASRNNTAANEEMKASLAALSGDLKGELAKTGAGHQDLADAVAANTERLAHISSDLTRLRSSTEDQGARLAACEQTIAGLARTLRIVFVLAGLTVFLCIGIVLTLLLHHA